MLNHTLKRYVRFNLDLLITLITPSSNRLTVSKPSDGQASIMFLSSVLEKCETCLALSSNILSSF